MPSKYLAITSGVLSLLGLISLLLGAHLLDIGVLTKTADVFLAPIGCILGSATSLTASCYTSE